MVVRSDLKGSDQQSLLGGRDGGGWVGVRSDGEDEERSIHVPRAVAIHRGAHVDHALTPHPRRQGNWGPHVHAALGPRADSAH